MNKVAKIFSYIAFVFAFCCMAIGYAAVQDTLTVSGSVSIEAQIKPFAVYGPVYDSNGNFVENALNFYNRPIVQSGDEIPLGEGKQVVTEVYTDIATLALSKAEDQPWSEHQTGINSIDSVDVIDAGIQPTNMAYWFSGLGSCTSFNLEKLDTSKVTDMLYMFRGCSAVQTLDLTGFVTSKVTQMGYMFKECTSLTRLDLSNFDTSALVDNGLEGNSEQLCEMFFGCSELVTLDISSFNTESILSIRDMFSYCGKLKTIYAGAGFDALLHLLDGRNEPAFTGCTALKGGNETTFNSSNVNAAYARIDGTLCWGNPQPGYFTCKHTYDETDICTICGAEKIIVVTTSEELTEAKASGKDYIVNGGTYDEGNGISANGVNVTANDAILTITNANAVSVSNGGTLTLNNVTEISNPNRAAIASVNSGTLIINSGEYSASSIAMGNSSGIVEIYGGTFTIYAFNGMSGMGFMTVGTMKIYGGTFNIEPTSPYLADGYVAQANGDGTWTVVAE